MCVNLYPFEQTLARGDASDEEIVENIDIGGPTMIRAAAKNSAIRRRRRRPRRLRAACSASCASPTGGCRCRRARAWPPRRSHTPPATTPRSPRWFAARTYEGFPPTWSDAYEKVSDLRYGENPHQRAAFYARAGAAHAPARRGAPAARQGAFVQQPARSELRARAGRGLRRSRHARSSSTTTPAAAPSATGGLEAYERAFACDPQSAYGGVIAVNRPIDRAFAEALSKQFIEVLLAPGFDR